MTGPDDRVVVVLMTAPTVDDARRLAQLAVTSRLAACVNIVPEVESVYRWEGQVESATEVQLIMKTRRQQAPALLAALQAAHPYDTPEGVVLDVVDGLPDYLNWVVASTSDEGG